MAKLYVIGNGFDLWHNLPTSYKDFYLFAQTTLDELESYYSFNTQNNQPWHDFENALGYFDAVGLFNNLNEVSIALDSFKPSHIYGLEDEITEQTESHVATVKETFTHWVNQLDVSCAERKMIFPEDALFITFNYTSTLQSVYEIENDRILHIHGRAEMYDDLIFGHGKNIVEPPEFYDDGESTWDMFSDAQRGARYPLYALRKPVEDVLKHHENNFTQLSNVVEIVVIGHSLNKIDQLYFCRIAQITEGAFWKVCFYSENEKECYIQSLINCGVERSKIELITYGDL
ncbi:bacteriophage abortive infection AbiH family protein [Proteus vulgaris]|uniref:bacteriophage abortive infection AbiH family protein n=1 Tax=Proteus vulgaris TaxID=585 RepID=UPI0021B0BB0D|nr:bacteriophage abortive infection AbiH family protein [Proteus vulgaris]MCT6516116.1 bacteriophage abortive infection AbiH family protein [Proteus vulgaris]